MRAVEGGLEWLVPFRTWDLMEGARVMNCVWVMCGLLARSGRGQGVELGGDEAGSIVRSRIEHKHFRNRKIMSGNIHISSRTILQAVAGGERTSKTPRRKKTNNARKRTGGCY